MKEINLRKPAVAGQFYSEEPQALKNEVAQLIDKKAAKVDAFACMLPHAGYMYSGRVAGETISCINIKDKIILLGPNHTGFGAPFSIMRDGQWQTPLGRVRIDPKLSKAMLDNSKHLQEDAAAHLYEHSLEVQLPLLQYVKEDFEFVPVVISAADTGVLKEVGKEIAAAIAASDKQDEVILIASSDMTHYEPQNQAKIKDKAAIEAILELNEEKLTESVRKMDISMCGLAPVVVMLSAAKALGAKKAKLITYKTSADATGDTSSVVGYAGIIVQ